MVSSLKAGTKMPPAALNTTRTPQKLRKLGSDLALKGENRKGEGAGAKSSCLPLQAAGKF